MVVPDPVKRFWRAAVLGVFFCLLLFLTITASGMFVSPDENANAVLSNAWATRGALFLEEPLNPNLHGLLHPRSILVEGTLLVPGSFLGLPVLAGSLATLFGSGAAVLLTPLFAVLALAAFRSILLRLSSNIFLADAGAFLLMFHPAFWYYASRPMMHNVPFLALAIFSLWFAVVGRSYPSIGKVTPSFVSGAFFGLALAVRTSEALWMVPLACFLFLLYRRSFSKRELLFWMLGGLIALAPFAAWNKLLYGALWSTGYTIAADASASPVAQQTAAAVSHGSIFPILFPFGIHLLRAGKRVLYYGLLLYPWTAILPLMGWIGMAKTSARKHGSLLVLSFVFSAYLAVMYGSWIITDNPNPEAVTIGNSYVRYWLPIFLAGSAWGAVAVAWFWRRFGDRKWLVPTCVLAAMLYIGASSVVVFGGEDGLLATRSHLLAFADKKQFVINHTEPEAIVVVDRADKFLFPDRRVVVGLRSDETYNTLGDMTLFTSVYYFGITLPEQDMAHLNEAILASRGLMARYVGTSGDESLYQILLK